MNRTGAAGAVRWLPLFVGLGAIWGTSFLFIKIAVQELHPSQVTLGRVAAGGLTLLVLLRLARQSLPRDPRLWGHLAVAALLMNVVPFTLFGYGEERVSSIFAGIWNATTPLTTVLVVLVALPAERPRGRQVAGLALGFVGVMVVLGVWKGHEAGVLAGHVLCFVAACSYGLGIPYIRRHLAERPESGLPLAAGQLLLATAIAVPVSLFLAGLPPLTAPSPAVIGAVLSLGVLGTAVAWLLGYRLIRLAGATTAAAVTYLIPVFAALVGIAVLGETLTWHMLLGALVVLVGVATSQGALHYARSRLRTLRFDDQYRLPAAGSPPSTRCTTTQARPGPQCAPTAAPTSEVQS